MKILQIGEPILEKKVGRVEDVKDLEIQNLIDKMIEMVLADETSAGLAAPQVGKDLAITVVKRIITEEAEGGLRRIEEAIPLINPEIVSTSVKTAIYWEGCLSVGEGDKRLFAPVERAKRVRIKYTDRRGNEQQLKGEGFFSHLLQHEMDHLNGILFITHVANPINLWTEKDLDKYLEKNGEFPPIVENEFKVQTSKVKMTQ